MIPEITMQSHGRFTTAQIGSLILLLDDQCHLVGLGIHAGAVMRVVTKADSAASKPKAPKRKMESSEMKGARVAEMITGGMTVGSIARLLGLGSSTISKRLNYYKMALSQESKS